MMIYNIDLISRLQDAGTDSVIRSLSYETIEDMSTFLVRLNSQLTPLRVTIGPLLQYLSDRHLVNELLDCQYDNPLPEPITRIAAPTDLGSDDSGIWFGTPSEGTYFVRWYVNGGIAAREERDLSTNRYITLSELGNPQTGDVVQIALESNNTVGWWGRITL